MSSAERSDVPGWGLFDTWHALIDAGDPRFTLLCSVLEVQEPLARLERSITVSLWNMQRHYSTYSLRSVVTFDASLRRKGVEQRMILPRRVVERRSPLASSLEKGLRLAPVAHPLLICDHRLIMVGDSTGDTIHTSTAPDIVAHAVHFYDALWRAAVPAVPKGEDPPFTRRMVDVAILLVDGATDREIARTLGISERTVSADVREMSKRLGARSRAHAIALISGAES